MKIKLELGRYDDGNETNELSHFVQQGQKKEILREPYGNWSILKLITITLDCSYIAKKEKEMKQVEDIGKKVGKKVTIH
ncbi:hypothetical protein V1478_003078 [Vespula squamosa]|uniref:Uncharacterized protein n=1 Tax=Vespula squamosa TaxID=30214 RepID=A0ABD2BT35_VESSQ